MQFAKVGSLIFNICFSVFFVYLAYIGGYFTRFGTRTHRFHLFILVLTILMISFTLVFLLVTSRMTNIKVLLMLNGLQCLLLVGSLWEQRMKVSFLTNIVL